MANGNPPADITNRELMREIQVVKQQQEQYAKAQADLYSHVREQVEAIKEQTDIVRRECAKRDERLARVEEWRQNHRDTHDAQNRRQNQGDLLAGVTGVIAAGVGAAVAALTR